MNIQFKHFTPRSHPELFHAYLALVYKVLISQQGWKLEANHRRKKVEVTLEDISSVFVVALDENGKVLGGVKGVCSAHYSSLNDCYSHHLGFKELERQRDSISILKNMVVADEYRSRKLRINGKDKTLSFALLEEMRLVLSNHGNHVIFASPTVIEAAALLHKAGFHCIDSAIVYDGPSKAALNMAWAENQALLKYFRNREQVLLNKDGALAFITKQLKSSQKVQRNLHAAIS